MDSERAWHAWGPGTTRYRSCPSAISHLPPLPPPAALSLHLLHSSSSPLFLSDARPRTGTRPAAFCLGKGTPVYADLGIVRWQNGTAEGQSACSAEGVPEEGNLSTGRQLRHLGVVAGRQSSVKFHCLRKPQTRGTRLARSQFGEKGRNGRRRQGEWRTESPRSIWRPLMQPQRIEHVLSGTGTVLSTTAGVSGVQDNRRAYSTLLLLRASAGSTAAATAALDRGPCRGRQTMPAHTPCMGNGTGVVGALLLDERGRGQRQRPTGQRRRRNPKPSICDAARAATTSRAYRAPSVAGSGHDRLSRLTGESPVDERACERRASQMASCLAWYRDVSPANQRRAIGFSGTTAKIADSRAGPMTTRRGFRIIWKANLLPRPTMRRRGMTGLRPNHEVGEEK